MTRRSFFSWLPFSAMAFVREPEKARDELKRVKAGDPLSPHDLNQYADAVEELRREIDGR